MSTPSTTTICEDGHQCLNQGSCELVAGSDRESYRCNCVGTWKGDSCELTGEEGSSALDQVDETADDTRDVCPDGSVICHNRGQCELVPGGFDSSTPYQCNCVGEWAGIDCTSKVEPVNTAIDEAIQDLENQIASTAQISSDKPNQGVIIGVSAGAGVAILGLLVLAVMGYKKKARTQQESKVEIPAPMAGDIL